MRRSDSTHSLLFGKPARLPILAAAIAAAVLSAGGAWAAAPIEPAVSLLFTIPVPVEASNKTGGMYAFDISWVDQATQTYFLGDRSNAAVDEANAATGKFIKQITATPPFAGVAASCPDGNVNDCSGPNGVVTGGACLLVGDAPSRVVSFLLPGGTQVSSVSTGSSKFRADEVAFDPKDGILIAANNADSPPFSTLIHVAANCKLTVGKKISFPFATNGAEQPVWDKATGLFYQSIPQILDAANPGKGKEGQIIAIDPKTGTIVKHFTVLDCQPAGLTLNPTTGELLAGCSVVFDTAGGVWSGTDKNTAAPIQVVLDPATGASADVRGVGASDEVAYNAKDNHFYTGSQGSPYAPHEAVSTTPPTPLTAQGANILGVIDGKSLGLDQLVPTFGVPSVKGKHPSGSGHSVAANDTNGWVFVPAPANNAIRGCLKGCIQVFARRDNDTD